MTTAAQTTNSPATTAVVTTPAVTTAAVATTAVVTTAVPDEDATQASAIQPGNFQNPVLVNDFADPFVFMVNGTFYAYATNANSKNIQVATSKDMVNWTLGSDACRALLPGPNLAVRWYGRRT